MKKPHTQNPLSSEKAYLEIVYLWKAIEKPNWRRLQKPFKWNALVINLNHPKASIKNMLPIIWISRHECIYFMKIL